jgi:hypothetical protein
MSLILSGTDGLSDVDGSAATPAIRGTDANTGMFFPAADTIAFSEGGVESMRLNSSGVLVTTNDASISGLTVGKGSGSGSQSTAVGYQSLLNQTGAGDFNTALGYGAGKAITTGTSNTALGRLSMLNSAGVTGSSNTGVGNATLYNLTSGSNNVAVGESALFSNATASNNTAVGYQAALANTTGINLVAVGYRAGYSNTTGNELTAIGYQALYSNTTSVRSTAVGYAALQSNTTGENTAVGYSSLTGNTTGTGNAAFGGGRFGVTLASLNSNTTGSSNSAFGIGTLASNTTGNGNVAVGLEAAYLNTTGGLGVYIGQQAGISNTVGNGNTMVGYRAGYTSNNTSEINVDNTCIGALAGNFLTTGYRNTLIGGSLQLGGAGYNLTTGFLNTFVGAGAGNAMTTGSKNSILGNYSGNQDGLDLRTASNRVVLADGDGSVKFYVDDADSQYQFADAGQSQFRTYLESNGVYANNATVDFANMSGLIIVNNWSVGSIAVFLVGGGNVITVSTAGGGFGGVTFTAGVYRWTNTSGLSYTFSLTAIATRPNA